MTLPKGYKRTEIGILPSDWEVVRLGEVCEIKKRKFDPKKNETIPCVELEHISQDTGMLLGFVDSGEQLSIKNSFSKGDVLYGKLRPYLRKFWRASFNGVCSSEIWVLEGKKVSNAFLFFLVQTARFSQIANATCGTKMPRADWKLMQDQNFAIPPLAEQEKIARVLSTWDTQIQNLESLIAEKQTLKKGLCQILLSAKTRLAGFDEPWRVVRLGDVAEIYQPQTIKQTDFSTEGYLVYGANGIIGKYHLFNHEKEQIAIACRGNTCGSVHLTKPYSWITGNAMVINLDDSKRLNKVYAYQRLSMDNFDYLITGSGQPQITSDIKNHKIPIPSIAEQEKIAEILSEADNEITLLEQKLESLKSQKKGLMQKLLNGKVRTTQCI
ncbi:restriction endonuclease subunit S [Helicobacter sp. faydin-H17]|nr:restriction endonuclease subunit S [Helicobacter kayseriensis]MCE3046541.1 restriction endonuclease subunit S [Helicobacter kayseriensis]